MSTTTNTTTQTARVFSYLRYSSKEQSLGDSERRQLDGHRDWAAQRGLVLDDRTFADRGVSAKAGKNMSEGELGDLVKLARPGDYILLEDQDRYSREDPITALTSLKSVAERGINVVFRRTGTVVNRTNFNEVLVQNFFGSLLAHQENEKRSFRIKQSWEKRYAELRSGKATRMKLPVWLKRDLEGKIILDEAKAETVREIFRLAVAGMGGRRIAVELNKRGTPTLSGAPKWNGVALLHTVLSNRSVLGDYVMKESRQKTGEIIEGIYPRVISNATWFAVNNGTRKAPVRTSDVAGNIATNLIKCPCCGGNMSRHRSHSGGRVYTYLICADTKAGRGNCNVRPAYDQFEKTLLYVLGNSDKVRKALNQPAAEPSLLAELRGKVADADRKAENIQRKIEDDADAPKSLVARLKTIEAEGEAFRAQLQNEERKLAAVTSPQIAYTNFLNELLAHATESSYRERVKAAVRDVVEEIRFTNKTTYTVTFRGGNRVEVEMIPGTDGIFKDFNWEITPRE